MSFRSGRCTGADRARTTRSRFGLMVAAVVLAVTALGSVLGSGASASPEPAIPPASLIAPVLPGFTVMPPTTCMGAAPMGLNGVRSLVLEQAHSPAADRACTRSGCPAYTRGWLSRDGANRILIIAVNFPTGDLARQVLATLQPKNSRMFSVVSIPGSRGGQIPVGSDVFTGIAFTIGRAFLLVEDTRWYPTGPLLTLQPIVMIARGAYQYAAAEAAKSGVAAPPLPPFAATRPLKQPVPTSTPSSATLAAAAGGGVLVILLFVLAQSILGFRRTAAGKR